MPRGRRTTARRDGCIRQRSPLFSTCALVCFDVLAAGVHTMTPEADFENKRKAYYTAVSQRDHAVRDAKKGRLAAEEP
jgi:hypothetical protein